MLFLIKDYEDIIGLFDSTRGDLTQCIKDASQAYYDAVEPTDVLGIPSPPAFVNNEGKPDSWCYGSRSDIIRALAAHRGIKQVPITIISGR